MKSTNARQSGTERWNDPEEGSEGQDVHLNVTKARTKILFYAREGITWNNVITQSKCSDQGSVIGGAVLNTNSGGKYFRSSERKSTLTRSKVNNCKCQRSLPDTQRPVQHH